MRVDHQLEHRDGSDPQSVRERTGSDRMRASGRAEPSRLYKQRTRAAPRNEPRTSRFWFWTGNLHRMKSINRTSDPVQQSPDERG